MSYVGNGKGDSYRVVNAKKFRDNYDGIKWKSKEKKIDDTDKNTKDNK